MKDLILIVDDNLKVVSSIKRALIDEPFDVYTAGSAMEGLGIMKNQMIKVVISDEMMPGMSGTEFLSKIKAMYPDTIRIILTGHASIEAIVKAVNSGEIYRFFTKPWNDYDLKFAIRSALDKYNLEEKNRMLLRTIKQQAVERKLLEKKYPGITSLDRDAEGNLVLQDLSENEFSEIAKECELKFG